MFVEWSAGSVCAVTWSTVQYSEVQCSKLQYGALYRWARGYRTFWPKVEDAHMMFIVIYSWQCYHTCYRNIFFNAKIWQYVGEKSIFSCYKGIFQHPICNNFSGFFIWIFYLFSISYGQCYQKKLFGKGSNNLSLYNWFIWRDNGVTTGLKQGFILS